MLRNVILTAIAAAAICFALVLGSNALLNQVFYYDGCNSILHGFTYTSTTLKYCSGPEFDARKDAEYVVFGESFPISQGEASRPWYANVMIKIFNSLPLK